MPDAAMLNQQQAHHQQQYNNAYAAHPPQSSYQQPHLDFMASQEQQQAVINQQIAMVTAADNRQYMPYATSSMDQYGPLHVYQNDLQTGLAGYPIEQQSRLRHDQFHQHQLPFGPGGPLGASPDSQIEVHSASDGEGGWQLVDYQQNMSRSSFESATYEMSQPSAIHNPSVALHLRTGSDSTQNDNNLGSASSTHSIGSYDEIPHPSMGSPNSENSFELMPHQQSQPQPIPIQQSTITNSRVNQAYSTSPSSSSPTSPMAGSPTQRRKKEPVTNTKNKVNKTKPTSGTKKASEKEKRVGRRRGPLRPEQRAQAGEIRKLRACLRCKFLKKTCDKGDPCAGCQPAHARLWQVPCTRIDIKEIGYFIKDWKADYERHVTLGFSIANIRGYSPLERPLFITHGFGYVLPIQAREVFVRDEDCFNVDWIETIEEKNREFEYPTARLTAGIDGVSMPMLSDYLDQHIAEDFEKWVDAHFEGTPFLTEMLKTGYAYYKRTKLPIIHKVLKLILAYNLTLHVTMIEGLSDEESMAGKIDDANSKYYGKTLAPVMINFQVKHALAMMWRDLQKDVLEELSALFSSVYNGERLKNWPTIFMLASILLAVWEEIQFDSHYRMADEGTINKFCDEMESTPVGVIVGLFSAISQKLPTFQEWDTEKHQHLLHGNMPICDAMTDVRRHVTQYEDYLKSRADTKFDRNNFDSLSNKFLSKLVIRAN